MLRDLEETLLRIEDADSRAYMKEAVLCYHGGAYRAAVVIAVAAGMDDLRRKLARLAATGGATKAVSKAHATVDARFQAQDAFEGTLLDHALPIDLVTPAEEKKLRITLSTRHLCGHPSGHSGSPEEARAAITTMVDLVMSRPAVLGMTAVTGLLDRLLKPNFFPKPDRASVRGVVDHELQVVSPAHNAALVAKLVASAAEHAQKPAKPASAALTNLELALRTMIGSARLRAEVWKRFDLLVEQPGAERTCLSVLSGSDGDGLRGAPPLIRMRALALIRRHLKAELARAAVTAWHGSGALAVDEVADFEIAVRALANSDAPSDDLTRAVFDLPWAGAIPVYVDRLVEGAGSRTWTVANACVIAMQGLTDDQAQWATRLQRVNYLKSVAANGVGIYPANEAEKLVKRGLGTRSAFSAAVIEQLTDDASIVIDETTPALVRLLKASGLNDAAEAVSRALETSSDAEE